MKIKTLTGNNHMPKSCTDTFPGPLLLLLHLTYSYNILCFYGTFCHIKVTSVKVILSTKIRSTVIMILFCIINWSLNSLMQPLGSLLLSDKKIVTKITIPQGLRINPMIFLDMIQSPPS